MTHQHIADFNRFLSWEVASQDTIDFKKIYADMAGGDPSGGLLLSQLVFYYLPDKKGNPSKLRVFKNDHYWIAKRRTDWWEECRLSPRQVDRIITCLIEVDVVEKAYYRFNGERMIHLRIKENKFMSLWSHLLEHPLENPYLPKPKATSPSSPESELTKTQDPVHAKGKTQFTQSARPLTKTTAQNTSKTTTTEPPSAEKPVVVSDPLSPSRPLSGSSSKKEPPISTSEEESVPGCRIFPSDDEPRVITLTPHPRAYQLVCTDCEMASDWPASDSGRRKHPLVCEECGAQFVVKTEAPKSGAKHTYSKPIARVATSWEVHIGDAPAGFRVFRASEADAHLLLSRWKDNKKAVLEGLAWMQRNKPASKWRNLATSLIIAMQTNGTRPNAWGVARPPKRPPPRPETDWDAAMREAAETNADLFAWEEEK